MAFYAVRGVPLDVLAAATPAERGFLQGARALYYDEQAALLQAAVAVVCVKSIAKKTFVMHMIALNLKRKQHLVTMMYM